MSSLRKFERQADATLQKALRLRFSYYNMTRKIDKAVVKAVKHMMKCRTAEMGGWKHTCECGEEVILYKSCHDRSCPACNGYENREWLEFHKERLVDIKYLHTVFVVPEELNELLLKNKKEMTDLFFEVVQMILKKRYKGMTGGIIITEHSEGSTLTLHHHLHCLVMLGVFDEKKNKYTQISTKRYKVSDMQKEFEAEYKRRFRKLEKTELKQGKKKVEIDSVKGFSVWKRNKYKNSAEAVLGYFSKGVRGGSISNDRILEVTESTVKFAYKNEQTKNKWDTMDLHIDEFLKRVFLHIPVEKQKLVRKYGVYASSKRKSLEKCKELVEGKKVSLKTKKEKKKEKREISEKRKVYCPLCSKEMKRTEEIMAVYPEISKVPA